VIGAAVRKDVGLLLRDKGALISLFLLPIVFILVFGGMFRFGPDAGTPRPIAIWVEPGAPDGDAIAKALDATTGFVGQPATSADEVRERVATDRVGAGIVVSRSGPVEIVIDLGAPVQVRGPLQGSLAGIVMRGKTPAQLAPKPEGVFEFKTPPGIAKPLAGITAFQVTVPGNAVLFGFFIALTVAMAFVNERKTGTWRRLLAAPVPRWKALLATLVPYYIVGVLQLAFLFGIGFGVFGMQIAGSLAALVVLSLALVACAVSLGLLMAAIARTEKQLGGIGSVVLLVMGMLGGCMFPRLIMPAFMKQLGLAVPHGWALDGYYAVLVREGTTVATIAPSIFALLGFTAAFAGLGIALFRFER
jgi:ABC-2 type transport system permease protein